MYNLCFLKSLDGVNIHFSAAFLRAARTYCETEKLLCNKSLGLRLLKLFKIDKTCDVVTFTKSCTIQPQITLHD